jgi:hypothetical protein
MSVLDTTIPGGAYVPAPRTGWRVGGSGRDDRPVRRGALPGDAAGEAEPCADQRRCDVEV